MQPAVQHRLDQVVQRGPDGVHVRLLAAADEAVRRLGLGEVAGQEDPQRFADDPGRGEQVDQHVPGVGRQADLLGQFPLRREQVVLAVDVQQPGRRLDQPVPDRVPVLPDQRDPIVLVEGDDADRAGMRPGTRGSINSPSGVRT